MIHLVFSVNGAERCREHVQANDVVVMLGEGTYVQNKIGDSAQYVMAADIQQRGLEIPSTAQALDHDDLVDLVVQHKVVSWT